MISFMVPESLEAERLIVLQEEPVEKLARMIQMMLSPLQEGVMLDLGKATIWYTKNESYATVKLTVLL